MVDPIELVEAFSTVLAFGFAIAAIISAAYCFWIYRQRNEEALFLDRLVRRNIRVAIAAAVIFVYIFLSRLELTPGRPWGGLIITIAVIAMMYGPISDALLWRKERRQK